MVFYPPSKEIASFFPTIPFAQFSPTDPTTSILWGWILIGVASCTFIFLSWILFAYWQHSKIERVADRYFSWFRGIADSVEEMLWIRNRKKVLYFNKRMKEYFALSDEAIETGDYRLFFKYIHPDDLADFTAAMNEDPAGYGDGQNLVETRFVLPGGETRCIQMSITRFSNPIDKNFVVGIAKDITDLKKTEDELQKTQSEMDYIHQVSPDMMITTRLSDGVILRVNAATLNTLEFSREELIGKSIFETGIRGGSLVHKKTLEKLTQQGSLQNHETTTYTKSGKAIPISTSAIIFERDGVPCVFTISRDISNLQQMQDRLWEGEIRQRSILDNASIGVFQTSFDGRPIYVNPKMASIYGYPNVDLFLEEANQTTIRRRQYVNPDDRLLMLQTLRQDPEQWHTFQFPLRRLDNSIFIGEMRVTVRKNPVDNEALIYGFLEDITDRKKAEEALFRAKEEAEAASCAKSEFLANMSHEIRTPMTSILGYADLLSSEELSSQEAREYLKTIRRNGYSLLSLINDILDLSKIEANRVTLEKQNIHLKDLVDMIFSIVGVRAEEKGLRLVAHFENQPLDQFRSDPTRLRQILVNLLGNAIKFTEQGEVSLTVRSLHAEGEPDKIQFVVSDSGIGMDQSQVEHIFQPFTQADGTVTRRFGGTGLGLTISQRLAQILGGGITVESELGLGSTFTVTIAVEAFDPNDEDASLLSNEEKTSRTMSDHQLPTADTQFSRKDAASKKNSLSGTVLLVDDQNDIRALVKRYMTIWGLDCVTAENGREAVDLIRAANFPDHAFDAIFMDIQMPEMDGLTAATFMRVDGYAGPLIALTAHAMKGDAERCQDAGFDNYLSKPIQPEALYNMAASCLKKSLTSST